MTEKMYLETFEKCPGSVCFPLLALYVFVQDVRSSNLLLVFRTCNT